MEAGLESPAPKLRPVCSYLGAKARGCCHVAPGSRDCQRQVLLPVLFPGASPAAEEDDGLVVVHLCRHAHPYRNHHDFRHLHRLCPLEPGSPRLVRCFPLLVRSRPCGPSLMLVQVKCVTPAAHSRQNGVLRSITILDILTDAFRKS